MDDTHAGFPAGPGPPSTDPVVDAYKRDVDRTLLRENLRLSPEERVRKLMAFLRFTAELRRAGRGIP